MHFLLSMCVIHDDFPVHYPIFFYHTFIALICDYSFMPFALLTRNAPPTCTYMYATCSLHAWHSLQDVYDDVTVPLWSAHPTSR